MQQMVIITSPIDLYSGFVNTIYCRTQKHTITIGKSDIKCQATAFLGKYLERIVAHKVLTLPQKSAAHLTY